MLKKSFDRRKRLSHRSVEAFDDFFSILVSMRTNGEFPFEQKLWETKVFMLK